MLRLSLTDYERNFDIASMYRKKALDAENKLEAAKKENSKLRKENASLKKKLAKYEDKKS